MSNTGLGGGYIADAGLSFKMVCLHLLEMAYCEVRTTCTIDKDWTENAISEALKKSINGRTRFFRGSPTEGGGRG